MRAALALSIKRDAAGYEKRIQSIISLLKHGKHTILNGIFQEKFTDRDLFLHQKKNIETADCVIADVTNPTMDLGGQIVYALTKDIPVLALIYKEHKDELTPMLSGNPSDNLFIEHYDEKSLKYVLKKFIEHLSFIKKNSGNLIVIDGGDGSGKATQTQLLADYLSSKKIPYRIYDFPQYYSSFHGETIGRLLSGEFGTLDTISPYLASLAYALDRAAVKEEMNDFLKKGGIIICNRYATSNMGHQAGRFDNPLERQKFLKWVYELEYKIHKIPKENIVMYLYVPWKVGYELTKKKAARNYTKGQEMDIVEKDMDYRKNSEEMFLTLCKQKKHWQKIDCVKGGTLRTKEDIHKEIVSFLQEKKVI